MITSTATSSAYSQQELAPIKWVAGTTLLWAVSRDNNGSKYCQTNKIEYQCQIHHRTKYISQGVVTKISSVANKPAE